MASGRARIRSEHFWNTNQKRHCLSQVARSLFRPTVLMFLFYRFDTGYTAHVYLNTPKWTECRHSYMTKLVPAFWSYSKSISVCRSLIRHLKSHIMYTNLLSSFKELQRFHFMQFCWLCWKQRKLPEVSVARHPWVLYSQVLEELDMMSWMTNLFTGGYFTECIHWGGRQRKRRWRELGK
jgi:hypothetical protein